MLKLMLHLFEHVSDTTKQWKVGVGRFQRPGDVTGALYDQLRDTAGVHSGSQWMCEGLPGTSPGGACLTGP